MIEIITPSYRRHREERSDAAIQKPARALDGFASLAMTDRETATDPLIKGGTLIRTTERYTLT
jgi:hypothetical protein